MRAAIFAFCPFLFACSVGDRYLIAPETLTSIHGLPADARAHTAAPARRLKTGQAAFVRASAFSLGEALAHVCGLSCERVLPDYQRYGQRAPLIRNRQMAKRADALVLVWDGQTRGSAHMLKMARERGLLVYEHRVTKGGPHVPSPAVRER